MYIEIRVQWTINFGSSHMRVHACDTEACDMCYVFNVNLTDSFDVTVANHVEVITAEIPDVVVHSVYKPPSEQFVFSSLGHRSLPQIVIGDFNSHNTIWGYDATDNNGVAIVQWAESNSLTLIHDAKLPKSFNSARWKKGYTPRPHISIFQH